MMSPDGSSTLITSAPRSAISLEANAAEIPSPHSTTLRPFKIPRLRKSPVDNDWLIAAVYHENGQTKNKPVGFSKKQVLESMEQLRRTAEREPRFSTKIRGLAQVPSRLPTSMVSRQSRRCPIFRWKRLLDLNHFSALVHSVSAVASFAKLPYPEPDMVAEHRI